MRSMALQAVKERREAISPAPGGLGWDVRHCPFTLDLVADCVAVIALVGMHDRALGHLLQKQIPGGAIGDLAPGQKESDRAAQAVGHGVDFRGSPTTRSADRLILFPPLAA